MLIRTDCPTEKKDELHIDATGRIPSKQEAELIAAYLVYTTQTDKTAPEEVKGREWTAKLNEQNNWVTPPIEWFVIRMFGPKISLCRTRTPEMDRAAVIVREYNKSKGYKYNYNGEACDYTLRDSTQLDEYRAKAHLTFFKIVDDTLNMMNPSVNAIVVDYAVNPTHRKFMKS